MLFQVDKSQQAGAEDRGRKAQAVKLRVVVDQLLTRRSHRTELVWGARNAQARVVGSIEGPLAAHDARPGVNAKRISVWKLDLTVAERRVYGCDKLIHPAFSRVVCIAVKPNICVHTTVNDIFMFFLSFVSFTFEWYKHETRTRTL